MPETNGGPTLGEVVRRLDEAIREIRETRREMAESHSRSEATYLRKAEFAAAQQTDAVVIRGLENEVHSTSKRLDRLDADLKTGFKDVTADLQRVEERRRVDRMWLIGGLAFPLILMLVGAVLLSGGTP
jgi:hypothetical protein